MKKAHLLRAGYALPCPRLFIFLIIILFAAACKKDKVSDDEAPFTVTVNNNPLAGEIFLTPYTGGSPTGMLYVLDQNGNIKQQKQTNGVAMNFRRWLINGQVRYTYMVEELNGYHIPGFLSYVPGYFMVTDSAFNQIARVGLLSYNNISNSTQPLLDAHDFILLSDNHYLTMAYYEKYVDNVPASLNPASTVRVVAPIIQEIQNGQVIWQWDGSEYPELYENSVEGNAFNDAAAANDYAHINSMFIDSADNNLICSFRNMDQVLKINRTNGNIIWKLGGKNSDFALTDDQYFRRQHNATIVNNKLLLFDNGEVNSRANTRILEFELDEAGKQIKSFSAYAVPKTFSQIMGSVQKHNGLYLIGGGSGNYVLEINPTTGEKLFDMNLKESSYRAFKYYY